MLDQEPDPSPTVRWGLANSNQISRSEVIAFKEITIKRAVGRYEMSIKSLLLDYMSGRPGIGVSSSRLNECSAILRAFVKSPQFDPAIVNANDSRYARISIVMPSFNQAPYIERSILSVLNQNYPNLQFIIMDGGSSDGTIDILRKYERYLTWRSEPDRGQSDAINKALLQTDGEWIGWLNSDDVYFPGVFHKLYLLSRARPKVALYSGSVALIDGQDRLMEVQREVRPSKRRLLYEGFIMQSQGVFWRRNRYLPPILCDLSFHYAMDFDLFLKLLERGPAVFLPELTGARRAYAGTKTVSAPEKCQAELAIIRKRNGVNDTTLRWKLARNILFLSSVLQRVLLVRRHCQIVTEVELEQ